MRALIIGIDGFVGGYLRDELSASGYEVIGTSLFGGQDGTEQLDILNADQVLAVIEKTGPNVIFNMAGQASAGLSWKEPRLTVDLNINGTIHILEAVRKTDSAIKVFLVGSAEQYGVLAESDAFVDENVPLKPASPYAVSKCTQEQMALLYARAYDMSVYLARSFNHIGVGQKKGFVVPDIAGGIVDVEQGRSDKLLIGNLSAKRDFSDVRDVVRAYRMIVEKGKANTVYNVGSGNVYCIEDLLKAMLAMACREIPVEVDASRMRKIDVPLVRCNNIKLREDTGWKAEHDIMDTLSAVLESVRAC